MNYERLSATDAAFLYIEKPNQPQHVGSLSFFEGGPLHDSSGRLRVDDLRDLVARRLHRVPRLRQRVMFTPFALGLPVWVDDDRFDLDYHLRVTALPHPGDERQLHDVMGRIMSQPLDRNRPLWEMWVVDGVAGDRVGTILKSHHALGDGIATVDLALAMVDLERDAAPDPTPPAWVPRPAPSPVELWGRTTLELATRPVSIGRALTRVVRAPERAARYVHDIATATLAYAVTPDAAPWNVPVTQHRRWASARVPLDEARAVRVAAGCTLNDVVVATVSGALRSYLRARGEGVDGTTLKAMVPVSTRQEDEHGMAVLGNKVSLFVVDLPVGEGDARTRVDLVHAATSAQKTSGMAEGAQAVTEMVGVLPTMGPALARVIASRIPMNVVVTNIPGPPVPLYLRGAKMLATYPYVEVVDNEGLTIAVVSYEGQFFVGITTDRDVMPDVDLLAEGIEKSFAELVHTVLGTEG